MANDITNLLPFRQYDDNDVVNMFAYDGGQVGAGSLVKITSADLNADAVQYGAGGFLNTIGNASSMYASVPHKVQLANSGDAALGILLRDVREEDENGEKIRFYPEKKAELQCVASGEAVPVATKGFFTFVDDAFQGGTIPAPMTTLAVRDGGLLGAAGASETVVGMVLATGSRETQGEGSTDPFEGDYAYVKIEL
jgi:hypothetical protein